MDFIIFMKLNNKWHREDGPAVIWYNKDGTINTQDYWLENNQMTKELFDKYIFKKKIDLI